MITGQPRLIAYRGKLLRGPMKRERISEPDVEQALRQQGHRSLGEVAAVVLETTGDLTVVEAGDQELETLDNVPR
jgi:uncharacterized membrane protein YcaP (DUF421 family)